MFKKRYLIGSGLVVFSVLYVLSALSNPQVVSSRAYSGHQTDADANNSNAKPPAKPGRIAKAML
jgi:hypothetical protein